MAADGARNERRGEEFCLPAQQTEAGIDMDRENLEELVDDAAAARRQRSNDISGGEKNLQRLSAHASLQAGLPAASDPSFWLRLSSAASGSTAAASVPFALARSMSGRTEDACQADGQKSVLVFVCYREPAHPSFAPFAWASDRFSYNRSEDQAKDHSRRRNADVVARVAQGAGCRSG
ncbi:MAG: hypothetical protein ACRECN_02195 [Methylocella sp.]